MFRQREGWFARTRLTGFVRYGRWYFSVKGDLSCLYRLYSGRPPQCPRSSRWHRTLMAKQQPHTLTDTVCCIQSGETLPAPRALLLLTFALCFSYQINCCYTSVGNHNHSGTPNFSTVKSDYKSTVTVVIDNRVVIFYPRLTTRLNKRAGPTKKS